MKLVLVEVLLFYLIAINLFGYYIIYLDKERSINGEWRIKENTIYLINLVGGVLGIYLSMSNFRHKTQKTMFKLTKLNLFLYIVLLVLIIYKIRM